MRTYRANAKQRNLAKYRYLADQLDPKIRYLKIEFTNHAELDFVDIEHDASDIK